MAVDITMTVVVMCRKCFTLVKIFIGWYFKSTVTQESYVKDCEFIQMTLAERLKQRNVDLTIVLQVVWAAFG